MQLQENVSINLLNEHRSVIEIVKRSLSIGWIRQKKIGKHLISSFVTFV